MGRHFVHADRTFRRDGRAVLRITLVVCWGIGLIICVCAGSMRALLDLSSLSFQLVPHPDWSAFFTLDFQLKNPEWLITKLGHFFGFAIMDLLFLNCLRRGKTAVACSVMFAIGTEILQVPFGRDGRLYDVGIDTMGILCAGSIVALARAVTTT